MAEGLVFKSRQQREEEAAQLAVAAAKQAKAETREAEKRHAAFEEAARREKDSKRVREDEKRQRERAKAREKIEGIGETRAEVEEMQALKLHGMQLEQRRVVKPDVAAREGFVWDAQDDTTKGDRNPLFKERVEPAVLAVRPEQGFEARRRKSRRTDAPRLTSLHWSEKQRSEMTVRDWRIFREDHRMSTRGGRVPHPSRTFEEMGLSEAVMRGVRAAGYDRPTAIQMQAIPCALLGRDVIGVAETGSGKTAAFTLPMLVYIQVRASCITSSSSFSFLFFLFFLSFFFLFLPRTPRRSSKGVWSVSSPIQAEGLPLSDLTHP